MVTQDCRGFRAETPQEQNCDIVVSMNKAAVIAIVYMFGIIAFYLKHDVVFAFVMLLALVVGILTKHFSRAFAIFLALLFIFGNFNMQRCAKTVDELEKFGFKNNVVLSGRIATIPDVSSDKGRARFYFKVDSAKISGITHDNLDSKSYVTINSDKINTSDLTIGNEIKISGKLRKPFGATNPSQFDYAHYLATKNTFSTFYAENTSYELLKSPEFSEQEAPWYILQKIDLLRDNIIAKHSEYVKSPNLEVLGGIVFGNDAVNPSDEIRQAFINSGLLHLLAASGLNVALIFGIWWFIASRLALPYRFNIISGMVLVVFYSTMTGFPPSILRAMIMLLFVLFGKLIDKEADGLSLVFFAGFVLLLFSPQMLFDVGFQLSFVVTIALIYCMPIISDALPKKLHKKKWLLTPSGIICAAFVPFVAQLAVAPIQAHYFNTFTPYSLFANLCVMPFIGLISFFGFISSIFGALNLDFLMFVLDRCVNPFIVALLEISYFFSGLRGSIITLPSPGWLQMSLYYFLIYTLFNNLKNGFKIKKELITLGLMALILATTFIKIPNRNFEILAFDVRNADSFLIKTPQNKRIMIDTASTPYRGKTQAEVIMGKYLTDRAVKKIDYLVLTHFDSDHSGGAVDIMKNFKVSKVIVENGKPDTSGSKNLVNYARENKIPLERAKNNEVIYSEPDFEVKTFVGPLDLKSDNENSVIVLINYKGANSLFMGDGSIIEYGRVKKYLPEKIDILKVGHHGAKGSVDDKMLKELKPDFALISTGYNVYGHPAIETLGTLSRNNVATLNTKELGAIRFTYDKNGALSKVENFSKNKFTPIGK